MAALTAYALGIMAVLGATFYVNHSSVVVDHYKPVNAPPRDPAGYYTRWQDIMHSPLTKWNKMVDEARVQRVHDTATGLPQYLMQHQGDAFYLSRLPKRQ